MYVLYLSSEQGKVLCRCEPYASVLKQPGVQAEMLERRVGRIILMEELKSAQDCETM